MADPTNPQMDTVYIGIYDSSMVVSGDNKQIILIQDHKTPSKEGIMDSSVITSFIIPIAVAAFVALIAHWLGKRRNQAEIDNLVEETEHLKKSFQPIVVATVQSVNDKLIDLKVKALKELTTSKSKFTDVKQQYIEGDPVFDYHEFLSQVFNKFSASHMKELRDYKDEYMYFFSERVLESFQKLFDHFERLHETSKSFVSIADGEIDHGAHDDVEKILKLYDETFLMLRKDLHLDSTIIEDFIESYQPKSKN